MVWVRRGTNTWKYSPQSGPGLPYNNVYLFTNWIYAGTDDAPKTTTVKSITLSWGYYDRTNNVIWASTGSWWWRYDWDTWEFTILDSVVRTNIGGYTTFYKDYILFNNNSGVVIVDRATKAKITTIAFPSGSYTWANMLPQYNPDAKYFVIWQWYANKDVYDVTTQTKVGSYWDSYYQVWCVNNKFIRTAENVNSWIYVSDVTSSGIWTATTVVSDRYWKFSFTEPLDTWLINKVTSSDFEFNAWWMWAARSSVWYVIIDLSAKTTIVNNTSSTASVMWMFLKYNDNYSIVWGNWNQNNTTWNHLWKVNRSTKEATILANNLWSISFNITSSWNICVAWSWILDIGWNSIYSDSTFITGFSKNMYNW